MELFVNNLTVIDFSYVCEKRGIVGESWIVDVVLNGELNAMSMVLDFAVVKKQIKAIIDEAVDHKLLLPMLNDSVQVSDSTHNENHEYVDLSTERGDYFLQSPQCAFAKIETNVIDIAAVTQHLESVILPLLPTNVVGLSLTLTPEAIPGALYHYTHGLKLHDGNCQRIAHGHRSPIHIYLNGDRASHLENHWCERWKDIYIASEADKVNKENIELSAYALKNVSDNHQYFAYQAPQGQFDIAVPANVLDIVDCDSTVELLADFILRQLKIMHPNDNIKVVAFEGVGKGATAYG